MKWIPTIDNKKCEWYSLKDRSIWWREYLFCYSLLFREQNKPKSSNILKKLESLIATKSFIHIFKLYIIMHKVSQPRISFLQKFRNFTSKIYTIYIYIKPWTELERPELNSFTSLISFVIFGISCNFLDLSFFICETGRKTLLIWMWNNQTS